MIQWVKVLVTKPADLSLILPTHGIGKNQLTSWHLTSVHILECTQTHTYRNKYKGENTFCVCWIKVFLYLYRYYLLLFLSLPSFPPSVPLSTSFPHSLCPSHPSFFITFFLSFVHLKKTQSFLVCSSRYLRNSQSCFCLLCAGIVGLDTMPGFT